MGITLEELNRTNGRGREYSLDDNGKLVYQITLRLVRELANEAGYRGSIDNPHNLDISALAVGADREGNCVLYINSEKEGLIPSGLVVNLEAGTVYYEGEGSEEEVPFTNLRLNPRRDNCQIGVTLLTLDSEVAGGVLQEEFVIETRSKLPYLRGKVKQGKTDPKLRKKERTVRGRSSQGIGKNSR